ncbi:hypothetical protein EDC01DRAFT_235263 [Geopyxis carbonaria]|nr:hypothetical protein EDC01DRAFT_235263 [Geopyxis carbonaria]
MTAIGSETTETVLAVAWILSILQIIVVGLRLWSVVQLQRGRINVSDIILLVALIFSLIGASGNTRLMVLMKRMMVNPTDVGLLVQYMKVAFAIGFVYYLGLYAIKASLLAIYFQLFDKLEKSVILWLSVAFLTASFTVTMLVNLLACLPLSTNWTPTNYCSTISKPWAFWLLTALSLATDLLVLMIPLLLVFQLKLSSRRNLAALVVIFIGAISIVSNIVRMVKVLPGTGSGLDFNNSQQVLRTVAVWSHVEWFFAFVAVCLPSYRALWHRWTSGKQSRQNSSGRSYQISSRGVGHSGVMSLGSEDRDTVALAGYGGHGTFGDDDSGRTVEVGRAK